MINLKAKPAGAIEWLTTAVVESMTVFVDSHPE